jgi:sulfatase modifying factor 1
MMNVRRKAITFPFAMACLLDGSSGCGSRTALDVANIANGAPDAGKGMEPDAAARTETDGQGAAEIVATNTPPSCQGGGAGAGNNCGASGMADCCGSLPVPGGTFDRTFDNGPSKGVVYPATVSGFRLDAYEVTVGRFRKFVTAALSGWRPAAGSGKHTHLNGGRGLESALGAGTYESGWDPLWNAELATTKREWDANLIRPTHSTWTANATTCESHPIDLVTWYEAYAFCIWDGGFLPSEAEWFYAASGGSEQRLYPWGWITPGTNTDLAVYGDYYNGPDCDGQARTIAPVGSAVAGNGKWGQSDLAGNLQEWNLDWFEGYAVPCTDCASVASGSQRVQRGGSFELDATYLLAAGRNGYFPTIRYVNQTARCARSP